MQADYEYFGAAAEARSGMDPRERRRRSPPACLLQLCSWLPASASPLGGLTLCHLRLSLAWPGPAGWLSRAPCPCLPPPSPHAGPAEELDSQELRFLNDLTQASLFL